MPQVIQTVDQVAFDHGQDILLVDFRRSKRREYGTWDRKARSAFVKWMRSEHPDVHVQVTFPPPSGGTLIQPYSGWLAVIVSEANQPDAYRKIVEHWERPDGTPAVENVRLFIVPKPAHARVVDDDL